MKKAKNFHRDQSEIFARAWWIALHISREAMLIYRTQDGGAELICLGDDRFVQLAEAIYSEIVAYTTCHVAERIRSEIRSIHGDTEESWDLAILYTCYLGDGLDKACGTGDEYFLGLLEKYYHPDYDSGYDQFWNIQDSDLSQDITLGEVFRRLKEDPDEETYNIDRLYVFRLSKLVSIDDKNKVLSRVVELYKHIGLRYYEDAFFQLTKDQILDSLADMTTQQEEADTPSKKGCITILLGMLLPVILFF